MKIRRMLAVSLSVLLVSSILVGLWAFSQLSILQAYAKDIQVKQGETSLNLTAYGFVEESRFMLDLFEYFTTQNLQWRGATTDPQGNSINVGLNLSFVEFQKLDPDNYGLEAQYAEFQFDVSGASAFIMADSVGIDITFWTCEALPALNVTAVLEGNVVVSLLLDVLPLPGLQQALYEFKGDRYVIALCILKPMEVTIDSPVNEAEVWDNVPIQASIKTASGIPVTNVRWWVDGESHYEGGMNYDPISGDAEATWETWHGPNGWYTITVRAEGFQEGVTGGSMYSDEERINVYVNNPPIHVTSWVWKDGHYEPIEDKIEVQWWMRDKEGKSRTPFDLERRRDTKLEAPGEWKIGDDTWVQFQRWVISDGDPNMGWIWENGGTGIGIDDWMLEMLYEKQLQCLYEPKQ